MVQAEGLELTKALIVAENEEFVLYDREAQGSAELVAPELGFGHIEGGAGIEFGVAQEPERATVDFVAAALDDGVHHGATRAPELSGSDVGLHGELLDRLGGREEDHCVDPRFIGVNALEHAGVGLWPRA